MARGPLFTPEEDAIIREWYPIYGPTIAADVLVSCGCRRRKPQTVGNHARHSLGLRSVDKARNGFRSVRKEKREVRGKGKQEGESKPGAGKRGHGGHACGLAAKLCERCRKASRVAGERFCGHCRNKVMAEMRRSGYLAGGRLGECGYVSRVDGEQESQL